MTRSLGRIAAVGALLGGSFGSAPVSAQKPGGFLRVHAGDSPPSMSMLRGSRCRPGAGLTGGGVDDPDQQFYENYACGAARNYTDYCNPELEKLFDRQSMEANEGKRKKVVWEIERKLAEYGARPIIFYNRFAYCWQPRVKGGR
jgi:ABC-type transport system substrate-binding protein